MDLQIYRKSKRDKLHALINQYENDKNNVVHPDFHRVMPFKSPTVIITGNGSEHCAGRNSIERYCLATGFKATKVRGSGKVVKKKGWHQGEYQSVVSLPIKIPGGGELLTVEVRVFDSEEFWK